jgi:hypothetical protein
VPTLSEKSPSLQTNVSLDKRSDNTITDTATGNLLQTPWEKQAAAKSFETLTTLPASWSSSKEEIVSPNLRPSKSESTFYNQSSIETLYVSPSFETFSPVKEIKTSKGLQKPEQASTAHMEDENLRTLTTCGESTPNLTNQPNENALFGAFFFYLFLFSTSFFCSLCSLFISDI